MQRQHRKWWSPALQRDMELLVFGERGTPVLVFPTSMGRFYQWEDFGLIAHMAPRIDAGWLQVWCVDSMDDESFYAKHRSPQDRIRAENDVPFLVVAGTSFGATHAAMLVTRHPGIARKAVCLSGAFGVSRWLDDSSDGYFLDPLAFLPGLTEERYLGPLRETEIVIATGELDPNVEDSKRLAGILQEKGVQADLHLWQGWAHDWPFWKEMVDVFL